MLRSAELRRQAIPDNLPWYVRLLANRSPLGFNAGDTNLYRYVGNSPTNDTDPSGLQRNGEQSLMNRDIRINERREEAERLRKELMEKGRVAVSPDPYKRMLDHNILGESEEEREFERGCVGWTTLRLGTPRYGFPHMADGVHCFKTFGEAQAYLKANIEKDKALRIFALQFDRYKTEEEMAPLPKKDIPKGEIDPRSIANTGNFNFSIWVCAFSKEEGCWENLYGLPRQGAQMVYSRGLASGYKEAVYCVISARGRYVPDLPTGK